MIGIRPLRGRWALPARRALLPGLGVLLVALGSVSLFVGYAPLPLAEMVAGLAGQGDAVIVTIMQELRLPRTVIAALVGAGLGLAGAVLQGLLRNPLAEPGVMGISSAAGLGAVVALYYGLFASHALALPISAMIGAGIATAILYLVAARGGGTLTLILCGVALGSLSVALTSLAMNLSANPFATTEMLMWLLGSIRDSSNFDVLLAGPFIILGGALLLSTARALDALSLGEDTARSLGVDTDRTRLVAIVGTAFCVGTGVSVAGTIGFIGLVIPHLLRPLTDGRPAQLLIPSALGGAALLLAADIGVRLMAVAMPARPEIHLGVVTALLGAPFFLYLILAQNRRDRW